MFQLFRKLIYHQACLVSLQIKTEIVVVNFGYLLIRG